MTYTITHKNLYRSLTQTNLHRLFTIIFQWSQATFMFLLVDIYIYLYQPAEIFY